MGVFIHCLDALSGRVLWTNDGSGSLESEQPHGGVVPNGPSPQGPLVLIEPQSVAPGERVFDVALQGTTVAKGVDVVAQTGGVCRSVLRTFHGIAVRRQLEIAFTPTAGSKFAYAALCGVEVRREAGGPLP